MLILLNCFLQHYQMSFLDTVLVQNDLAVSFIVDLVVESFSKQVRKLLELFLLFTWVIGLFDEFADLPSEAG